MHRPHSVSGLHLSHFPLVVVDHYLPIARTVRLQAEADAPLRADPNAALTLPVAPHRLQPIARQRREIAERLGARQQCQPADRLLQAMPFRHGYGLRQGRG